MYMNNHVLDITNVQWHQLRTCASECVHECVRKSMRA